MYAQIFDNLPVGYQLFITSARDCGQNLEILGSRFGFRCQAVEKLAGKKRFAFPRVKPEIPGHTVSVDIVNKGVQLIIDNVNSIPRHINNCVVGEGQKARVSLLIEAEEA